jgi:hypothetical protein
VQLRKILTIGVTLAWGMATTASAEESLFKATPMGPLFASGPGAAGTARNARPIFGVPSVAAAAQGAAATTSTTNDHMFGVGIRLGLAGGIEGNGIGGSVRYFFRAGPLGVQGELSRYGLDVVGIGDSSSVVFSASAIYRFVEQRFDAPVSLTPYAGAGLSFVNSNLDDDDFPDPFDDTSVGVLLFGGVELFFEKIPNLGVSGELTINSNDDISFGTFGTLSLGGVAFTAAGHWYFK